MVQTTGATISMEIKPGSRLVWIHTRAKIIKDATGVARRIPSSGESSARAAEDALVTTARIVPSATPIKNPSSTRSRDRRMLSQNSSCPTSRRRVCTTFQGEGTSSS